MTIAAVAFMPWISASSSSVRVTSEAAVGDSPCGPVLKTRPSISASEAAPVPALGVAPGVASWAVANRGVTPTTGTAIAPAARTENRRRLNLLLTVFTSRNASTVHTMPGKPLQAGLALRGSRFLPPFQEDPTVTSRFLLRTLVGIELDGDPAVIADLPERRQDPVEIELSLAQGEKFAGGIILEMDVRN